MFSFAGFLGIAIIAVIRILIFVAVITFFLKQYKKFGGCRSNALKMLDEKYINDEITEEDYIRKRSIIIQK